MAEIVQSLFGVSPESYQQAQQQRADAQALQYAQLTPFQQANYAIGRGANMLGGAIGGALGGQDPELQRITRAQQIASQIDFTDPQSFKQGMAALGDDTQSKLQLAQIFRQQQESGALIGQRNAAAQASIAQATRERAPPAAPTTPDLTNARAIAAQAGPEGSPEYNAAFRAEYQRLTTKEAKEPKGPAFGTDREAVAAEVYNKQFAELTPTERAVVNKRVEDENKSKAKAGATTLALPGQKELVDIPAFRAKVQATIDAPLKALQAIDNALPQIEDAIKTDNFATYRAAQTQFARAIAGAGDLSQKELKAAGADPSLLGGAADYLSQLATSTPTKDTMQKMRSAMQIIQRVNTARAQSEIDRQRKMAAQSGYPTAALDTALDFGLQTAPAAGGTLAEQAAAELKRRQSKGK
jgi:AraC-like DNA-binding protein